MTYRYLLMFLISPNIFFKQLSFVCLGFHSNLALPARFQEGNEKYEGHTRQRGEEADAEKVTVPQPLREETTHYPGQNAADVHQPGSDGKMCGFEIRQTGSHQEGDENRGTQSARKLIKGMDGCYQEQIEVTNGRQMICARIQDDVFVESKGEDHIDEIGEVLSQHEGENGFPPPNMAPTMEKGSPTPPEIHP